MQRRPGLAALAGALLCALLLCAGCSLFTSKSKAAKKKADEPTVLVPFVNRIAL